MLIKKDFGSRVFYVKPEDEARFAKAAEIGKKRGDAEYPLMIALAVVVISRSSKLLIKGPDDFVSIFDSYYI